MLSAFVLVMLQIFLPIVVNNGVPAEIGESVVIELPPPGNAIEWPERTDCEGVDGFNQLFWNPNTQDDLLCNLDPSKEPMFGLDIQKFVGIGTIYEDGYAEVQFVDRAGVYNDPYVCFSIERGCGDDIILALVGPNELYDILSDTTGMPKAQKLSMGWSKGWVTYRIFEYREFDYPMRRQYRVHLWFYDELEPDMQEMQFWFDILPPQGG